MVLTSAEEEAVQKHWKVLKRILPQLAQYHLYAAIREKGFHRRWAHMDNMPTSSSQSDVRTVERNQQIDAVWNDPDFQRRLFRSTIQYIEHWHQRGRISDNDYRIIQQYLLNQEPYYELHAIQTEGLRQDSQEELEAHSRARSFRGFRNLQYEALPDWWDSQVRTKPLRYEILRSGEQVPPPPDQIPPKFKATDVPLTPLTPSQTAESLTPDAIPVPQNPPADTPPINTQSSRKTLTDTVNMDPDATQDPLPPLPVEVPPPLEPPPTVASKGG